MKPESNIRSSMQSINYPESTRDQASKSFEKLKKKKDSVLRPKTAAGIIRVSVDNNDQSLINDSNKPKVVFTYQRHGDKENKRDNSISTVNKSLSHN